MLERTMRAGLATRDRGLDDTEPVRRSSSRRKERLGYAAGGGPKSLVPWLDRLAWQIGGSGGWRASDRAASAARRRRSSDLGGFGRVRLRRRAGALGRGGGICYAAAPAETGALAMNGDEPSTWTSPRSWAAPLAPAA
jgi:hypothetical protein